MHVNSNTAYSSHRDNLTAVSQVKMLFLGDSLTAGYQLDATLAFPNQLELKMGSNKITAINQGISGDTSHTLLNRLDFTLQHVTPNLVFLCIGANDGLRHANSANRKKYPNHHH